MGWDPRLFMPEHHDGALAGRGQVGQAHRFVGQFDANDLGITGSLPIQPAHDIAVDPMDAGRLTQGVSSAQRLRNPGTARNSQTRSYGIAGTQ